MSSEIEKIRIDTFEEFLVNYDKHFVQVNREFRIITFDSSREFIAATCLKLFEFILYANYIPTKRLVTKCDIDRVLLRNRSKCAKLAKKLLSDLYQIRNNYAHSNWEFNRRIDRLKETLASINSMLEFKSILRLLIPVQYPANINNFYFLVERQESNAELNSLKQGIRMLYCNTDINPEQRNIGTVYTTFSSDYNQDALALVVLQTLSSYYKI